VVSGVHLWLVLWKVTRTLEARAEASIASLGMCRSDFGVLDALLHKGPLAVHELGAKVLLTSGSITTAIDRLERRGLVARGSDPRDRRARIIRLTPAGRKTIGGAFAEHERAMEQAVSHLGSKDRATLLTLLRHLGKGERI
jgi:MarR family transcriptional regulator, 2-MHQ and catechol-resistance regulon repressor